MAATLSSPWTPEMDATLKAYFRNNLPAHEVAALLGMSQASVRSRASRIGIKLVRQKTRIKRPNKNGEGHKPFTDRCGQLLRAAGVKI